MIYTKETTPAQDAALELIAAVRSERLPVPLTAAQFLEAICDGAIADAVAEANQRTSARRQAQLNVATKADVDAVDAILSKYPG